MSLLFIDNWFNNAFIQALGWTLFHSLWQGFLLVVLISLAIVVTKRSSAATRYRIFSSLFFIFIGATLCTFIIEFSSLRSIPTPSLLTGNDIGDTLTLSTNTHTAAVDLNVPLPGRLAFYFNEYGPWLMLLWFIVFMLKSIRLGINYAQVQRIRNEKPYLLPAIEKRVNELAKLLRIRRKVILRETTSITVPVTIGFLKPLILIPCGLINNLPPDQVEAILLHELAHIRRADYLVNLLQCMAETVFFFNPAVIWLSSLLREERENCCDDIAITVTQNKSLFIHALVAFQEYHAGHPMAPGLQGNKYPLLKRIQRIVYNNNKKLNHMEKIFLAAGLVVTGIVALAFTTPATNKKPDARVSIDQKSQPGYSALKDTVPEHKVLNGSLNSTIDGKKYKVVVKNDKPVELYIDEKRIPDSELENHHQVMERIMEAFRGNSLDARAHDEEAKKLMDGLYQGQSRQAQKRNEEAVLMEKLFKEQDQQKGLANLETKADVEKKMKLFQDDQKGNELFNQQKKMELQERFLKELKDDKSLNDLQKDNFLKDLQNDKEGRLFKGDNENTYKLLLLDKLKKGGEDEKLAKEYLQLLEKQNKNNNKNRNEAEKQLYLEKNLQLLYQDTSKPKKVDEKIRASKEQAEYEKRMARLEDQKKKMNDRMKEKDEDYKERMRRMDEYKAMLRKELLETEEKMDKEKRNAEKEGKEARKENDKERERVELLRNSNRNENHSRIKEERTTINRNGDVKMDYKLEVNGLKEREKAELEREKRNEANAERVKEAKERTESQRERTEQLRKEQRAESEERRKQMQKEMQERRKEQAKERDTRRAELIQSLKDDGIIDKDANSVSIHINDQEMIVNGVKQPDEIFKKYREKMGKKTTQPNMPKPAPVVPVLKLTPTTYEPRTIKLSPVIKEPTISKPATKPV